VTVEDRIASAAEPSPAGARWRALALLALAELLGMSLWFSASASVPALRADEAPASARVTLLRAIPFTGQTTYWEYVASQVANGFPNYSLVAATTSDSTPAGNPRTLFMVEARGSGHVAWDSPPDSGYSVDNIGPPAPAPFAASYAAGVTNLHWSPPAAPDLAGYRLYRGSSSGFVPGPGNLIGTPPDTTFADNPGGFYYYKVSAVDAHGNESPTTLAFPSGTTDVPVGESRALELAGIAPNPLHDGGVIHWSLPRSEHVRIAIADLAGRHVATLADEDQPAGPHFIGWDARDAGGQPVASGIYFLILEAEGRVLRSRLAVVR